ncbi:MAG: hypothetical protein JWN96_3815, partial [Mycobacterium sp.]|nr:hypothetical protein [Mycobacterium sp.]
QAGTLATRARSVISKAPEETLAFSSGPSSNGHGARIH